MRRAAALAGSWYPSDPRECREAILRHARSAPDVAGAPSGLIGPHAGWVYSGDCAGKAYGALGARRGGADLVVVFGSHRGPRGPHTLFRAAAWDTPLGPLETDRELAERVNEELDLAEEPVRPLQADNAVELHLPFIRHFFPRARLLMLGVGASTEALEIGRRVGDLVRAQGRDAVFIGSTDLTHYGPGYGFAPARHGPDAERWVREVNDAGFIAAVEARDARGALEHALANQSACCPGAVAATFEAIGESAAPTLLEHTLSIDVRPAASFVGYASFVL